MTFTRCAPTTYPAACLDTAMSRLRFKCLGKPWVPLSVVLEEMGNELHTPRPLVDWIADRLPTEAK